MTTDPAHPDDDPGFEPVEEGYGFADPEPPPRPPLSLPPADEPPVRDQFEITLDEEPEDRPRRRRRRRGEEGEDEPEPEGAEEPGDRILRREEVAAPPTWWVVPAGLFAIGFALSLAPAVVLAAKSGVSAGAGALALVVAALIVQVVAVTGLLVVVGQLFGIDYGPAVAAVVKLAAVVAVVDGLTAVIYLTCTPLGLLLAALVGAGVFQYLFRLSAHEMMLSVVPMIAAAWVLNAAVFTVMLHEEQKKKQKDNPASFRLPGITATTTVESPALPFPSGPRRFSPVSWRSPPCSPSGVARSGSATAWTAATSSPSARSGPA
ncbi:MAG TPA: hypothetical protein VM533_14875 [Fimbriiglobus sp.]|nr:hypothetical protein [Fimbriiglobus sp.]